MAVPLFSEYGENMTIEALNQEFTVCRVKSAEDLDLSAEFTFAAHTDGEFSLVCPTGTVPAHTIAREDGWRGMRITGTLDFSLIGILAKITGILASAGIGIFAVSTYNTDYIFVKAENSDKSLTLLEGNGYAVIR